MKYPCPRCGGKTLRPNGYSPAGRQRYICRSGSGDRKACYTTTDPKRAVARTPSGGDATPAPVFRKKLTRKRRYLVTGAQNATPVHKGFLTALEQYANAHDAELLVIPLRYKNPTSRWSNSQANDETWDPAVAPYLFQARAKLNKNIVALGDVKTQPTATSPLTGFDAITHSESGILAHTKLQLRTVPAPHSRFPKILTTTGACTVPNYTDSKAGALGAFHHTLGAALVEIDGSAFHLRQINADKKSGSFIDLNMHYGCDWNAGKPYEHGQCEALVMGDMHVGSVDPAVERATFGPGGIVETLRPKVLVWHDLFDGYSINPHHGGNPFVSLAKIRSGRGDAAAEVQAALDYVDAHTPEGTQSVIVDSNHNDFLHRWILGTDWRTAPGNAEFYLETALCMARSTRMGAGGAEYASPFAMWAKRRFGDSGRVTVLGGDASLTICGVEIGLHGDRGPNGARGSLRNLRRIGTKMIIGHSHSPGIDEGGMQVGTSTRLRLEYNHGPSSWLNTHAVVYANGKRSLINIIQGKWRLQ